MPQTILLVDDDDNIRENYTDILEDREYAVVGCRKAADVAEVLSQRRIDLVILDISMNGDRAAGHTLCKTIKMENPYIPVLMLTSLESDENRRIAAENGSDGYLIKSADADGFLHSVKQILA